MSDEIAVAVHNVSKRYLLYDRPQDRFKQTLFRRLGTRYEVGKIDDHSSCDYYLN